MAETSLFPRYIAPAIQAALQDTPVVCLIGARQVGKTTLVQQLDGDRHYFSLDERTLFEAAQDDPDGFIRALPRPVIVDEIQRAPDLLPAIKLAVDQQRQPGDFIVTGSANLLLLPMVRESLAGRMAVIHLQPLTEAEKHAHHDTLLESLLTGDIEAKISGGEPQTQAIAAALCTGGYPEASQRNPDRTGQWFDNYLHAVIERDVRDIATIHDHTQLRRLVELAALRTATLANTSSLAKDVSLERRTVERYLTLLEKLFLIRRLPAWHRNHAKRLIRAAKLHVVDSGLAAYLNNLGIDDWASQPNTFGRLLESFVVQQLISQSGWVAPELRFSHYRDKDQVEVDLVIERGRTDVWGVEVKRSGTVQPKKDGAGLRRLAEQCGETFRGGMLLYSGLHCVKLPVQNCYAVPLTRLWSG